MVREAVSGLVLGLLLVAGGIALYRSRRAIVSLNYEMRRPLLGRFVTRGMIGGDRLMVPVLSAGLCALGLALIVFTIYSVASGR